MTVPPRPWRRSSSWSPTASRTSTTTSRPSRRRPAPCWASTTRAPRPRSCILNETMQDLAYTTHTYKHTTIGFLADIKDMPNQYDYSEDLLRPLVSARELHGRSSPATWTTTSSSSSGEGVLRRLEARDGRTSRSRPSRRRPRSAIEASDLAVADPADPLHGLPHPRRRPEGQPRHRRPLGRWRRPSSARRARSTRSWCSSSRRSSARGRRRGQARPGAVHPPRPRPRRPTDSTPSRAGSSRPWPTPPRSPSSRDGWRRSSRTCATASPLASTAPTPSPWPSPARSPLTGRPDAMNDLYAAYDRSHPRRPPARREAVLRRRATGPSSPSTTRRSRR